MMLSELKFVEITDINDDLLLPWLRLWETAFPPVERILVSDLLKVLKDKARGLSVYDHLIAALDESGKFVGLIQYEIWPEISLALFWYLAVDPDIRGRGLGAKCYAEVKRRAKEAGAKALLFEVELPEESDDPELARRRIEFYRRQGALLLSGIRYLQFIGTHQPVVPMHIMLHPFEPMTPRQAFGLARKVFGDYVTQTGELELK